MIARVGALQAAHWPRVRTIYEQGIATGHATFETDPGDWETWDRHHLRRCRLVAGPDDRIAGWAALAPVSAREVYAGVAEVSVYVAAEARGRGIGRLLLSALVEASEAAGIWTLQAGIFPENTSSVRLHRSCGFRDVGVRRRLARLGTAWKDVLIMERRSTEVGR